MHDEPVAVVLVCIAQIPHPHSSVIRNAAFADHIPMMSLSPRRSVCFYLIHQSTNLIIFGDANRLNKSYIWRYYPHFQFRWTSFWSEWTSLEAWSGMRLNVTFIGKAVPTQAWQPELAEYRACCSKDDIAKHGLWILLLMVSLHQH